MSATDVDPAATTAGSGDPQPVVSVVIPAFNEAENLAELVPEIAAVLGPSGAPFEIVVIDDGSTDDTPEVLSALAGADPRLVAVRLRRNVGKSGALGVAFERARGETIVLMDGDGQDDPSQIPLLLDALGAGLDLVTGCRASDRRDRFVKRNTSKVYNWATARVSGVEGRDFNSGFKAMSREVMESLELYGELHRYIPVLAAWSGFRIGEMPVEHHARRHGRSKFGRARFWRGFLDLVTVKFLTTYDARPFHFFGGIGALLGLVGSGLLAWMLVVKLTGHSVGTRPALMTGVLLVIVAVQFLSLGLLAELMVHLRRRGTLDVVPVTEPVEQ